MVCFELTLWQPASGICSYWLQCLLDPDGYFDHITLDKRADCFVVMVLLRIYSSSKFIY